MPEIPETNPQKSPIKGDASGNLSPTAILLFITGILAFGLLVFAVREVISPFIICALVLGILYPIRRDRYVKPILAASIVLSLLWGLYDVSSVLLPFALAFVVAFILDPLVTALERYVKRWVSALIIILTILGIFAIVGIYVLPPLFSQLGGLVHNLSALMKNASVWIKKGGLANMLNGVNLPRESVRAFVDEQITPRLQGILEATLSGALNFVSSTSGMLGQVVNAIILPIITFYLLMDFPALRVTSRRFAGRVNPSGYLEGVVHDIDGILSAFLRGQAIVALIIASLAIGLFLAFGIPYAFVLGLMIFVFDFVPFVGLFAMLLVSLAVVLFAEIPTVSAIITVVAIILVLHLTEIYGIGPRIIGKKLKLHPVVVILSFFVAAQLLGFFGMLISVPAAAVFSYLLRRWISKGDKNETNEKGETGNVLEVRS